MIEILKIAIKALDEKIAQDIVILDMDGISPVADYFVICHGNNEKHMQAIAREIRDKIYEAKFKVERIEGFDGSKWILVDLGDVIVHVFDEKERYNYHLEKLWGDVPRVDVNEVL